MKKNELLQKINKQWKQTILYRKQYIKNNQYIHRERKNIILISEYVQITKNNERTNKIKYINNKINK